MPNSIASSAAKWLIKTSHLFFVISLLPLLLTGLRIAVANEPKLIWLSMALPQGDVHQWHFIFAFTLIVAIGLYVAGLIVRKSLPKLKSRRRRHFAFRLTHYVGMLLLITSLTTGLMLFLSLTPVPVEFILFTHLISAITFVAYLLIHGALAFFALPWRTVMKVFWIKAHSWPLFFATVGSLTALIFGITLWLNQPDLLVVLKTSAPIDLDGDAREQIWQDAPVSVIQTYQGYRQPQQGTQVSVQAAYDSNYAYFLVSWNDSTRSQTHLPLIKTEEGWVVLQSAAGTADENEFYEDKLAIMLSESGKLAGAGTVQLGQKPIGHQPAPQNKRGLHYTTDQSITDVWHWKSVRTGLSLQQVDDNFFGPATPSGSEYKRYTGGYQKDKDDCEHLVRWDGSDYQKKPECGGFVMNWKLYSDDIVTPIRLPKHPKLLAQLGQIDQSSDTSDFGSWWLDWDDTIAYHPDDDNYPIGTIMPSVLSLGPFSQGRGDVSAAGYWRDGRWQLELKRKLTVTSKYDLPIKSGMHFWVSTFDHSQTRHSYHLRPLKIELKDD